MSEFQTRSTTSGATWIGRPRAADSAVLTRSASRRVAWGYGRVRFPTTHGDLTDGAEPPGQVPAAHSQHPGQPA